MTIAITFIFSMNFFTYMKQLMRLNKMEPCRFSVVFYKMKFVWLCICNQLLFVGWMFYWLVYWFFCDRLGV